MNFDEILTDGEKAKLEAIASDPVAVEAVRKIILTGVYYNGTIKAGEKANPTRNFALALAFNPGYSAERVGEDVKACAQAIMLLEKGLAEIESFKKGTPTPTPYPPNNAI
jgi:hypothetical protein